LGFTGIYDFKKIFRHYYVIEISVGKIEITERVERREREKKWKYRRKGRWEGGGRNMRGCIWRRHRPVPGGSVV